MTPQAGGFRRTAGGLTDYLLAAAACVLLVALAIGAASPAWAVDRPSPGPAATSASADWSSVPSTAARPEPPPRTAAPDGVSWHSLHRDRDLALATLPPT